MDKQSRIIALETSSRLGSVAVALGSELLADRQFSGAMKHTGELLAVMAQLCREQHWRASDIDQLYVSAGPGSFTGLRIAITVAKTLAFAQEIKIVAVPSCEATVLNAERSMREDQLDIEHVAVVLDAKRKQIYASLFEKVDDDQVGSFLPSFRTVIEAAVMTPEELLERSARPLYLLGEGLEYHREELTGAGLIWLAEKYWQPRAENVYRCGYLRAQAGDFADAEKLTPIYLRRPEAEEKWEKLHGKDYTVYSRFTTTEEDSG